MIVSLSVKELFHILSFIATLEGPFGTTLESVQIVNNLHKTCKYFYHTLNWDIVVRRLMGRSLFEVKLLTKLDLERNFTKVLAKKEYRLTDADLEMLQFFCYENSHSFQIAMYKQKDLITLATLKYGSKYGLEVRHERVNMISAKRNSTRKVNVALRPDCSKQDIDKRRADLFEALNKHDLAYSAASKLCNRYIERGNLSLVDVVVSMVEGKFFRKYNDRLKLYATKGYLKNYGVNKGSGKSKAQRKNDVHDTIGNKNDNNEDDIDDDDDDEENEDILDDDGDGDDQDDGMVAAVTEIEDDDADDENDINRRGRGSERVIKVNNGRAVVSTKTGSTATTTSASNSVEYDTSDTQVSSMFSSSHSNNNDNSSSSSSNNDNSRNNNNNNNRNSNNNNSSSSSSSGTNYSI